MCEVNTCATLFIGRVLADLRPRASRDEPFKALVFDSDFDHYRGVVANVALFGGEVRKGDRIVSAYLGKSYEINELGILRPQEHQTDRL